MHFKVSMILINFVTDPMLPTWSLVHIYINNYILLIFLQSILSNDLRDNRKLSRSYTLLYSVFNLPFTTYRTALNPASLRFFETCLFFFVLFTQNTRSNHTSLRWNYVANIKLRSINLWFNRVFFLWSALNTTVFTQGSPNNFATIRPSLGRISGNSWYFWCPKSFHPFWRSTGDWFI